MEIPSSIEKLKAAGACNFAEYQKLKKLMPSKSPCTAGADTIQTPTIQMKCVSVPPVKAKKAKKKTDTFTPRERKFLLFAVYTATYQRGYFPSFWVSKDCARSRIYYLDHSWVEYSGKGEILSGPDYSIADTLVRELGLSNAQREIC